MSLSIDLNADLGEGFPADEAMLALVTSANIACGFHAGGADTMRRTLDLAARAGTAVGAHPGFADRENFGRIELAVPPEKLFADVAAQLILFAELARAAGISPRHAKPHGALYHLAARDRETAEIFIRAVVQTGPRLIVFAPGGSMLARVAEENGLLVAGEVFADRNYLPDGGLVPRTHPDAVLHDARAAAARMASLLRDGSLPALDGTPLRLRAGTICIHGDTPHAQAFAQNLRAGLAGAGISLHPPWQETS